MGSTAQSQSPGWLVPLVLLLLLLLLLSLLMVPCLRRVCCSAQPWHLAARRLKAGGLVGSSSCVDYSNAGNRQGALMFFFEIIIIIVYKHVFANCYCYLGNVTKQIAVKDN